jgi:hypothetical protein
MSQPEKTDRKARMKQTEQDLKNSIKEFVMPDGVIVKARSRSQERRLTAQGGQALDE